MYEFFSLFVFVYQSCGKSLPASSWFLPNPRWMTMLDAAANLECSPTVRNKRHCHTRRPANLYSPRLYPAFPQIWGLSWIQWDTSSVVFLEKTIFQLCHFKGLFRWWIFLQNDIVAVFVVIWQLVSNHSLIRFKRFVSWISSKLCN